MASWIKMRTDLATDPAVAIIAKATRLNPYAVVGRLHAIWAWADSHTEDGRIVGIDAAWVDKYVGKRGFAEAMVVAGWLTIDADGIILPSYTSHNGATAKRRAKEARRKGEARQRPQDVRDASALDADNLRNREEKRREEKTHPTDVPPYPPSEPDDPGDPIEDEPATGPHFLTFWNAYPRRGRKRQDKARAAWVDATRGKGADPALIVQKAHAYASSDDGRGTYCLSAWRWLEDGCWNDDPEAWSDKRDDDTQPAKPKRDYEALAKGGAA